MKTLSAFQITAALLAATFCGAVRGADFDDSRFSIRGFGTVGLTTQSSDGLEFRRDTGQSHGVEDGGYSFDADSIAGAQLAARVSSAVDVVAQGLTRRRADGSWTPEMSQAFVRFSPDDSLVIRAGRVGYDIYLLAESRQVGYSYLAIRPSPDFYGVLAEDTIDGGDIGWSHRIGRGIFKARAFAGGAHSETAFADRSHIESSGEIYGATFDYTWRGWMARAALVSFGYDTNPGLQQLAAGLMMTGVPQAEAIADNVIHHKLRSKGLQLGIAYDDGPILTQLLWGAGDSDSIAGPEFNKFYGLFGYRMRDFTPYLSFAWSRDRHAPLTTGLPDLPQFAPLNDAVAAIQASQRSTQHTTSIGVRYDLSSNFDFKLQVDRTTIVDSALFFDRRTPPGGPSKMTVVGAAVDFVF